MSIALKKQAAGVVPPPAATHLTFFVDENGNPSLKDSAGVVTPATNAGGPLQINEQGSPPAPVANAIKLYAQDVAGRAELFTVDDAGESAQITQGGSISSGINVRWKGGVQGDLFASNATVPTLADVKQILIDPTTALNGEGNKEGVVVAAGDRVLRACALTGTESQVNNGIYIVAVGSWTRATDADTGAEIQDAIVELVTAVGPPPVAVRWAFWNPTGIPITVGVDAQDWVPVYLAQPGEDADAIVVSVTNITLSGLANVVDDVTLNTPDQTVLVAGQSNPVYNGLWDVKAGAWERYSGMFTGLGVPGGYIVNITSGTLYTGRQFILNAPFYGGVIVGVDPMNWILLDTEDLAGYGPIRVNVNFNDAVMGRSPYASIPCNGYNILTLPPITPEHTGKVITFVSTLSVLGSKEAAIAVVFLQPAGTDSVGAGGPGELMCAYVPGPFQLFCDGVGWSIFGALGFILPSSEFRPEAPTP